jgi:hypothetical protein
MRRAAARARAGARERCTHHSRDSPRANAERRVPWSLLLGLLGLALLLQRLLRRLLLHALLGVLVLGSHVLTSLSVGVRLSDVARDVQRPWRRTCRLRRVVALLDATLVAGRFSDRKSKFAATLRHQVWAANGPRKPAAVISDTEVSICRDFESGSDGTRTRDLRRDRPLPGTAASAGEPLQSMSFAGSFGPRGGSAQHGCVDRGSSVWATSGPRNGLVSSRSAVSTMGASGLEQVCVGAGQQLLESVGGLGFGEAERDRMLRIGSRE